MENKINLAEILKDCPKGMELDCTMWDNVTFIGIEDIGYINILIKTPCGQIKLSKEGCFSHYCNDAKCVIFPKGKTTWEGFQRPFRDGDICYVKTKEFKYIFIFKVSEDYNYIQKYATLSQNGLYTDECPLCITNHVKEIRLATEEEKQKLFQAIKDNDYKWNPETKTLEKLIIPKFKVGDWVVDNCSYVWKIKGILNQFYLLESVEGGESRPTIDWVDKTFHLWTIADAKDGDVLCTYECNEPKIIFILKGCLAPNDEDIKPASKEQRDLLFQK